MKKVLFMPVGFFEYDKIIENTMRNMGYEVTVFSPMASYGKLYQKVCNTITKGNYIKNRAYKLQQEFFAECQTQFDYVLAIVGRDIDAGLFVEFKKKQTAAKFILYIWDDLEITKKYNFDQVSPLFDEIVSFCPQDCEQYGFRYRPTFYTELYRYDGRKKKYEFSMMGTSHSGRVEVWNKIVKKYNISLDASYLFLLCGNLSELFAVRRYIKKEGFPLNSLHIFSVPLTQSAKIMLESKVCLDIQQTHQKGVTMRTYESMFAHTKLITTNQYVKEYDFYNPNNICVIDKENPEVPKEFWETEFEPIEQKILNKYTVNQWVMDIFDEND